MGLMTAKKRNEGWLKKIFVLARSIILDMRYKQDLIPATKTPKLLERLTSGVMCCAIFLATSIFPPIAR
jgi:hypothetical protein